VAFDVVLHPLNRVGLFFQTFLRSVGRVAGGEVSSLDRRC
jgi:hypothetical protein